jgi:hypothetical protein
VKWQKRGNRMVSKDCSTIRREEFVDVHIYLLGSYSYLLFFFFRLPLTFVSLLVSFSCSFSLCLLIIMPSHVIMIIIIDWYIGWFYFVVSRSA